MGFWSILIEFVLQLHYTGDHWVDEFDSNQEVGGSVYCKDLNFSNLVTILLS